MKSTFILPTLMIFAASTVNAQSTNTITVDRPNYGGTRTTVIDPATGTASRDGTLTRKADGAVATREFDRTRTADGVTIQGNSTNFAGETRNLDYNRSRTSTGSTATGTLTRRNGEAVTYAGSRTRGDGSFMTQQNVTGANGQSLYARTATTARTDAGITRSVNATRAPGFPPRAGAGRLRRR